LRRAPRETNVKAHTRGGCPRSNDIIWGEKTMSLKEIGKSVLITAVTIIIINKAKPMLPASVQKLLS